MTSPTAATLTRDILTADVYVKLLQAYESVRYEQNKSPAKEAIREDLDAFLRSHAAVLEFRARDPYYHDKFCSVVKMWGGGSPQPLSSMETKLKPGFCCLLRHEDAGAEEVLLSTNVATPTFSQSTRAQFDPILAQSQKSLLQANPLHGNHFW